MPLSFRDKHKPHEMMQVREIRLHLRDLRDLFIAPEMTPVFCAFDDLWGGIMESGE